MASKTRMRVGCDGPLGVEFVDLEAKGGGVIVTERVTEAWAAAKRYDPTECELLTIVDLDTNHIMWPRDDAR